MMVGLTVGQQGSQRTPIHLEEQTFQEHDDWWRIKIRYPQVEANHGFNEAVHRSVMEQVAKFKRQLELDLPRSNRDSDRFKGNGSMDGAYTAKVLSNGVISVLFDYGEYTPGAVHPWGVLVSVNYDVRNERALSLADLFLPHSDYVTQLSRFAIASLRQREGAEEEAIKHGASPVATNFRVFTLTETELVLHFQQYQVAPGADPGEDVAVPLSTLTSILRERYRPAR
jgi:hypothetical protein